MTKNTHARVAGEDALKAAFRIISPVGDDNHSSMLRKTDANAAAVVDRYPGRACGSVNQRIEERPICDRVAAVEHSFGFAIRRCDRACVEMIAPDDNRRFDFTALHQFVHGYAELGAFAVSEPADPRRQPLKLNSFTGELHPASERLIFRK